MSQLNPLNDLSRVYLDHVAKINQQNESDDVKRWQEGENDLQKQIRISSGIIASGGAPTATMEEEKKAAKDYDGDGKIESGKDEYFGSKDKAIKKAMGKKVKEGYQRNPEADPRSERQKRMDDPDTGINSAKFRAFMAAQQGGSKKVKKESRSNWRNDLSDLIEVAPMTDVEAEKVVKEKKVNNKVTINPKMSEAVAQIGGELIAEKEVDVPDTRRTVDAIRAYDRSKDASRDATYDTDKGNKKKGDKEKKYAAKERGEIKKDDPNWKNRKYHTGMHGEETEVVEGYGKKMGYNGGGVVKKEMGALEKANKTMKDKDVVKADKIDTPNYKGQKFGVKEADDWIQGAVKRPGAFTRKAKAAGQSVQQFAKTVDDNPGKYSTRTKKQANLAQTFASMKKEDVEELFYTLIAE